MAVTVTQTTTNGFPSVAMQNDRVRATVLPSLGGRVWELTDLAHGRQWIWHRHDRNLSPSKIGSQYDDVWAGGWEELFPNDAPGRFEGRALPDHGEWWTTNWKVEEASEGEQGLVRLAAQTRVIRCNCTKTFRLRDDSDELEITYAIQSLEPAAFHFLFKQHFPVAITSSCRLTLPGGRITPVDASFGTLLRAGDEMDWPGRGPSESVPADLSRIPPRSERHREFVYVTDVPEGWCGVDDLDSGASLRLHFERLRLPYVWLFLSYGGWRDCYTAVLEPCTNLPKDLGEASRQGRSASLGPGHLFETTVKAVLGRLTKKP
jgi:hypothetical protein